MWTTVTLANTPAAIGRIPLLGRLLEAQGVRTHQRVLEDLKALMEGRARA